MNDTKIETIEQIRQFLAGTSSIEFSLDSKEEGYRWIEQVLTRFGYRNRTKTDKGLVLDFIEKVSGYSRIQTKRLVRRYLETGKIGRRRSKARGFARKYTKKDIRLLARTDVLHGRPSGPTVKKLCERAFEIHGQGEYRRLAGISVPHIYNLRRTDTYRRIHTHFDKTRPKASSIGERRKPDPGGRPGCLRVDTVHQGDSDRIKGLYHINAVDEVTQFEIVCAVEKISEQYLIPVLETLLEQFPFVIHKFHTDNGSEYINRNVLKLLDKLLIELTKSRARHSNDNALAEGKNASIVRKHLGYVHIPQKHAPLVNKFLLNHLNPYVNYHRPCFFAEITTDAKGKQKKTYPYRNMMTPYEKLKSLPNAENYLKPGQSFHTLDAIAYAATDNLAAERMNRAKFKLFKTINEQVNRTD